MERAKRENVEVDLSWLLKKMIVWVVDKLIKCSEFILGIKQVKDACMAVGVLGGKQVIREQVASGKFTPGEPSALLKYTQAIHVEVNSFLEKDFASYLQLGELDMEGLRLLCTDPDFAGECPKGSTSRSGPSPCPRYVISVVSLVMCGLPLVCKIQTIFSFEWLLFCENLSQCLLFAF